jgi:hypothetical protein
MDHWSLTRKRSKNTCNASVESKGFCLYKATNGIKRHLAVDTLGFPFFTHCTPANVSDDVGLIEMFTNNIEYFKSKPVNIPKITILLDHGYHIDHLVQELQNPSNHDKKSDLSFQRSIQNRKKKRTRKVRIYPSDCTLGSWTVECMGGTLQDIGKELWKNIRNAMTKMNLLFC